MSEEPISSDELRRRLGRAAGDGDLEACRKLQDILEREGRPGAHPGGRTTIDWNRSQRGFMAGRFLDRYNAKCSIQDSSIATEDCLWLGIDDVEPKVLVPNEGWKALPIPPEALISTRMHVDRTLARQLVRVLKRFLETGSVAPKKRTRASGMRTRSTLGRPRTSPEPS